MDKLEIIDFVNKDKGKKFLKIDDQLYQGENYIGYMKTGKKKKYIKLADEGEKEIKGRVLPIFSGFIKKPASAVIMITVKKGTGKTLMGGAIADDYHKLNPKNPIYYICSTSFQNDENLSKMKFIKDFDLSQLNDFKILDDNVDEINNDSKDADVIFQRFNNCLFLFDDLDSLSKQVSARVNRFRNLLLELSRKRNISVVSISHYETNYAQSRLILRELDYYITFNDENLKMNRLINHYKKIDITKLHDHETYLIINFNLGYIITNERTFIIS